MILIDKLAYSSAIRNKSPFLKAGFAVSVLLVCTGARSFVMSMIILLLMGFLIVKYSKTSAGHFLRLMLVPLAFLLLGTVAIIFNFSAEPLDLLNLPLGNKYLAVSTDSLLYGLRLIITALGSVSCLYFLILTTPLQDLLYVLKRLKCPALIIELMMLSYRYIFVLLDMASAITTAQKCRLGNRSPRSAINGMGGMLASVLMRALGKANMLYDAMESRGYDGEINVLQVHYKSSRIEKLAAVGTLVLLVFGAGLCRYYGGI